MMQCRQWNYADQQRRSLEFVVDDFVFLKVSPKKGMLRFGTKGKGPRGLLDRSRWGR